MSFTPAELFDGEWLRDTRRENKERSMAIEAHQLRVIQEKEELDAKIGKLAAFIGLDKTGEIFAALPIAERVRLYEQLIVMRRYSEILGRRIAAFPRLSPT